VAPEELDVEDEEREEVLIFSKYMGWAKRTMM